MKRTGGCILGLAFSDRKILAAEVNASGALSHTGSLDLPDGPGDPTAIGAMLRKFLKERGFSANRAVLGLPARQIMARPWQLPPSTPLAAAAILRLAGERQFPPELKDLIFDYSGAPHPTEPSKVLLLATSKPHLDHAVKTAEAAGLSVSGITSSSMALAAALTEPDRRKILVSLSSESTEIVVNSPEGPRLLRHLPVDASQLLSANGNAESAVAVLGSELMRASLAGGESANQSLLIWDGLGIKDETSGALARRYGLDVSATRDFATLQLPSLAANGQDSTHSVYGPAVALALLARRGLALPVDFLHSRLAPPKQRRVGKKIYWAVAAVLVIVLAIIFSAWSLHSQQAKLNALNARLKAIQPALASARALDAKVRTANAWYNNRPATLDCLLHLTQAFPQEGIVWASNISLKPNGTGTVTGRALDYRDVLSVYDHIKNDPVFSNVVLNNTNMRQGNSNNTVFSISFTFNQ